MTEEEIEPNQGRVKTGRDKDGTGRDGTGSEHRGVCIIQLEEKREIHLRRLETFRDDMRKSCQLNRLVKCFQISPVTSAFL